MSATFDGLAVGAHGTVELDEGRIALDGFSQDGVALSLPFAAQDLQNPGAWEPQSPPTCGLRAWMRWAASSPLVRRHLASANLSARRRSKDWTETSAVRFSANFP
jgi:hypothetical protein